MTTLKTPTILDERIQTEFRKRFGFELLPHLIMACYMGSETHGTRDPDKAGIDDVDIFGVIVPPPTWVVGLREWDHFNFMHEELDVNVFSLRKWVSLLLKNNPNMLGTLWLKKEHYHVMKPAFMSFLMFRDSFSSMRAYHSFSGYAYAQISRLHKGEFKGYMGEKRKELVQQFGYDPKMASHLIRLYRMGIEFVETGVLNVYRDDAQELIDIKKGKWTLERVKDEAARLETRMLEAKASSPLPDNPDEVTVDALLTDVMMEYLKSDHRKVFDSLYL